MAQRAGGWPPHQRFWWGGGPRWAWIGCLAVVVGCWLGAEGWVCAEPVGHRPHEAQLRTAKVAGRFYPEDPAELLDLVTELLGRQPEPVSPQKPRILIVPHAGYQYSGLIAATGFRQVQGRTYDGVVVVGFTHRAQFTGSSADTRQAYETPLGELPVDQEAVAVLQTYQGVGHVEEAHTLDEHSLEVALPFLQVALERFRLVPVLMGSASLDDARHLATALAHLARLGDYLFVFSTDLSHYHPYSRAEVIDEGTINAILFETPQAVHRLFARGELEACGQGPIVTSLLLAARLGYPSRQLLYYANSGDTSGELSRVVGYAAIAMHDRPVEATARLSPGAGEALVAAARASLERSLASTPADGAAPPTEDFGRGMGGAAGQPGAEVGSPLGRHPELSQAKGVFVTLRKKGRLRGCIGRIQTDEPLASAVPSVALDAALRDSRFIPVSADELVDLHVEVSVLTPPVRLRALSELVAGRDGVILEYQGRSGVFLPQVWEETGWTRLEFLRELASQKAELPPDAWQQAALYVFQDQTFEEPPRISGSMRDK